MPDPRDMQDRLLKEHGAVLARKRKHEVWKLPDGRTYVRASTPSDVHADDNALRQLRTLLGVNGERGIPGERRQRQLKRGPTVAIRAELSQAVPISDKLAALRESLMAVARLTKPKYKDCYPMEKITILRTPLTVLMRRVLQ